VGAQTSERVAWLPANSGSFMICWINQIVVMISGLFLSRGASTGREA